MPETTHANSGHYRLGVDIGGTFTDVVLLGEMGKLHTKKVSSSVDNYADAIINGVSELLSEVNLSPKSVTDIRHGTTVGSNAILERRGATVGLIGTRGFRDILDIRTLRMPRLYDLRWEKPLPLVERRLRVTVDERMDASGHVVRPLDPGDAEQAIKRLLDEGVDAIAVSLLHAYVNPRHELQIKEAILQMAPGVTVCISSEVLPEIKEYERTSTTVINAFLKPVVSSYLRSLRSTLDQSEMAAPILLMQSNGGLTTDRAAAELPVHIVESGPAGGVVGAQALAASLGIGDVITFDMGGTTAKASLLERGTLTRVHECEVGGGAIVGSRLLTGAGYTLKVPAIDIAEVGAGGGSIVALDAGGSLRVGPRSAGAYPGPICYDTGGTEPTITDANIVLGYLNPYQLVDGGVRLNAAKAIDMFRDAIALPLGLSVEDAALGAHRIAAANMIRAIKSVSTERGRDPRRCLLFAFGGNGPLFAAGMAEAIGIKTIIVPPIPGLFSSFGFLCADVQHHYSRTFRRLLRASDPAEIGSVWSDLEQMALRQLADDGFTGAAAHVRREASLHYKGQTFELTVPVDGGEVDRALLHSMELAFHKEHETTYGHRAGDDEHVELMTIHVTGYGISDRGKIPDTILPARMEPRTDGQRNAYFGERGGWLATPVIRRSELGSRWRTGPFIIEEYDATCLVPPQASAKLDERGNIVIELANA